MPRPDPNRLLFELEASASWTFARSSGPGGQNVNKVNTKAQLAVDLEALTMLSDFDRQKIRTALASRLDADGRLTVTAQDQRTQGLNRTSALARALNLILLALLPVRPRHATKPTRASKERRLTQKRHGAATKSNRSRPSLDQ